MRRLSTLLLISMIYLMQPLNAQVQIGADILGEAANDYSGSSLSISANGQFLAIGAPKNAGISGTSGHLRVYQMINNSWTQLGADIDGDGAYANTGGSVAISDDGTRVITGSAFKNTSNGGATGQARVYEFDGTNWNQLGTDINGEVAFDYAGHVVSMSANGGMVAVGSTHHDANGMQDCGHVRVFEYDGTDWIQKGNALEGEGAYDNYGWSVQLTADGNHIAVGAYKNQATGIDAGHVRIYNFNGTNWAQKGGDIDGEAGDRFGWDVDISDNGNRIVVGATHNTNTVGFEAGKTSVFEYTNNNWTQLGQDLFGESLVDWFGYSVSISGDGNVIASSALQNDGGAPNSGNVRVFQLMGNNWMQAGTDMDAENIGDWFGYAIDLSNTGATLAVGALNYTPTPASEFTGNVRCYDMSAELTISTNVAGNFKDLEYASSVSPNPNQGAFSLTFKQVVDNATITITDITGQLFYHNNFSSIKTTDIAFTGAKGIYFMRIDIEGVGIETVKVIQN